MLKIPVITVADGENTIVFPADSGGLGYRIVKGVIPDDMMLRPKAYVAEQALEPVVRLGWNDETNNLVPLSVDGKGIDAKTAVRISKALSNQMKDFTSLRDFFPEATIEQFATVAILRTSAVTHITPEEAKTMAAAMVGHQLLNESVSALTGMGFTPNRKAISGANPLRNRVGQNLLADEDTDKDESANS